MPNALDVIRDYIDTHGPARSHVIAKATGYNVKWVSMVIKENGLPRPQPKTPVRIGVKIGSRTQLSDASVRVILRHARPGDTLMQTVDKLLRGDAKPHPSCGCSLCLRSRERPGDV